MALILTCRWLIWCIRVTTSTTTQHHTTPYHAFLRELSHTLYSHQQNIDCTVGLVPMVKEGDKTSQRTIHVKPAQVSPTIQERMGGYWWYRVWSIQIHPMHPMHPMHPIKYPLTWQNNKVVVTNQLHQNINKSLMRSPVRLAENGSLGRLWLIVHRKRRKRDKRQETSASTAQHIGICLLSTSSWFLIIHKFIPKCSCKCLHYNLQQNDVGGLNSSPNQCWRKHILWWVSLQRSQGMAENQLWYILLHQANTDRENNTYRRTISLGFE